LAVLRSVAIASPHADIPTSVPAPAIDIYVKPRAAVASVAVPASVDINANPRTPIISVAVPTSVDIHIDIGAATLPTMRPRFTRLRMSACVALILCRAASLAAASARPGILTLCTAGSFLLGLLLDLLYESPGAGGGGAGKECRCLLSAYAESQYRCGGA